MSRITTDRSELDVTVRGDGEPVLLIHGSVMSGTFDGMCAPPELAGRFRLITYSRHGFDGSSHSPGPYSLVDQAADALAVLREFAGEQAHVVGHSYGAAIGMQLALDAPDAVRSLALLEPPILMAPSAEAFMAEGGSAVEAYSTGDKRAAVDAFMQVVGGPDYRSITDAALGAGWFEQAVNDADTLFAVEFPALQEWSFGPEEGRRITQPVLVTRGDASNTFFAEGCDLLKEWIPHAETYTLPGANHLLQIARPTEMAQAVTSFIHSQGVPAE